MTSPTDYATAARTTQSAFTSTLDRWKDGVTSVAEQFRSFPTVGNLPQVDVTEAVERQFEFIQRIVDLNHEYARQLAEVANTLTGATRSQLQSVDTVVREQVASITDVARSGADKADQAVREQAEQAEEAERQEAREAAKAERAKRKEAADNARARYTDLSKAELSEEAAKRDLPKTGTVEELVARLVEADTK